MVVVQGWCACIDYMITTQSFLNSKTVSVMRKFIIVMDGIMDGIENDTDCMI